MTDWHCHLLPGIDDGAATFDESLAMAAALAGAGFTEVYCTPHLIRGCYEASADEVLALIGELQERLDAAGIPLRLHQGREYFLDEYLPGFLEEPFTLGSSRQVLVEIPPHVTGEMVRQLAYGIVRRGLVPVIAHPERCRLLEPQTPRRESRSVLGAVRRLLTGASSPEPAGAASAGMNPLLGYLCDLGCRFQANLGSFAGIYGREIQAIAVRFRDGGLYDRSGSDLHAPGQAPRILPGARRLSFP